MIRDYGIIRESAQRIADAADRTVEEFRNGLVEQEPAITDRLLARMTDAAVRTDELIEGIRASLDGFTLKGVRWTAKTLTDRGRGAQEKEYGADFMGVLAIELPEYSVRKGFLAQAKIAWPDMRWPEPERERMRGQCRQMLELSPASFVFLVLPRGRLGGARSGCGSTNRCS